MTDQHDGRLADAHAGRRFWDDLAGAVGHAVVGDAGALRLLAVAVLADGHALIEDVPGVGKTLLARAFSRALGLELRARAGDAGPAARRRDGLEHLRRPAPSGSSPARSSRTSCSSTRSTVRRRGRRPHSSRRCRSGRCRSDGETRPLPEPFLVLATENPVELEGHIRAARGGAGPVPRAHHAGLSDARRRARDRAALPLVRRAAGRRAGRHRRGADPAPAQAVVREQTFATGSPRIPRRPRAGDARAPGSAPGREPAIHGGHVPRGAGVGVPRRAAIRAARKTSAPWRRPCWGTGCWSTSTAGCAGRVPTRSWRRDPARCRCRSPTPRDRRAERAEAPRRPSRRRVTRSAGRGSRVGLILIGAIAGTPGLLLIGVLLLLTSVAADAVVALRTAQRHLRARARARSRRARRSRWSSRSRLERQDRCRWRGSRPSDLVSDGRPCPRATGDRERPARASRSLRNTWTLGPWERVTTHFHVGAERRGVYRFGPVRLQVADLFGRDVAVESDRARRTRSLVRPRASRCGWRRRSSRRWARRGRATASTTTRRCSPASGPYQAGDPRRAVHWRATARLGRPVSKRFEPATLRRTLIALDMQTNDEPYWMMLFDEELLESVVVAAASLARYVLDEGGAVGSPRTPGAAA